MKGAPGRGRRQESICVSRTNCHTNCIPSLPQMPCAHSRFGKTRMGRAHRDRSRHTHDDKGPPLRRRALPTKGQESAQEGGCILKGTPRVVPAGSPHTCLPGAAWADGRSSMCGEEYTRMYRHMYVGLYVCTQWVRSKTPTQRKFKTRFSETTTTSDFLCDCAHPREKQLYRKPHKDENESVKFAHECEAVAENRFHKLPWPLDMDRQIPRDEFSSLQIPVLLFARYNETPHP